MSPAARARPKRKAAPPANPATPSEPELPLPTSKRGHPTLGLGLWSVGRWGPEDEIRTRAVIDRAMTLGLRWFDTAEVYGSGRSERLLGDALSHPATATTDPFIATKVSWEHLRPAQVRAAVTASLQRLGRRSIDLYLVHAPDPKLPIAPTMQALEALWKEGKIGAIGVSNFSLEELEAAEAALSEARIAVNQVRFNLLDREDAEPVKEHCEKRGIVIEAYTPLLRGLLAGRYLDGKKPPADVRRFTHRMLDDESLAEMIGRAQKLRALADQAKLPMASLALHWLRREGAVPVFGATRPEQVEAAVEAFARRPDDATLERADRIGRGG